VSDSPMHRKFPEDSANRYYAIFEELSDSSALWRGCVFGMENVELEIRELSRESNHKFFALGLQCGAEPLHHSLNAAEKKRGLNFDRTDFPA